MLWSLVMLAIVALGCPSAVTGKSRAEIEAEIDEFVEAVLECQEIPGLSLSVVKAGQVRTKRVRCVRVLVIVFVAEGGPPKK